MNKIERLLIDLVSDMEKKGEDCDASLSFWGDDFFVIFSKKEENPNLIFMDIQKIDDMSFKIKFEYDFPVSSIRNFLDDLIDKDHFLLSKTYNNPCDFNQDLIFNDFVNQIESKAFTELKSKLEYLLLNKEVCEADKDNHKKLKI